jgi:hypothetical protein
MKKKQKKKNELIAKQAQSIFRINSLSPFSLGTVFALNSIINVTKHLVFILLRILFSNQIFSMYSRYVVPYSLKWVRITYVACRAGVTTDYFCCTMY